MVLLWRMSVLVSLLVAFSPLSALATVILYNDFSDTTGLDLNGSAAVVSTVDGQVLRLTPALNDRSGSTFSGVQVNAADFSTFFKFRITSPGGILFDGNTEVGADGIVFVVQSVSSSIGGAGGGIGYGGINNSVGVEFDTWHNSALSDPSSNHVGIDTQGNLNHGVGAPYTVNVSPNFDDGEIWYAWIDYDGTDLEVRLNQTGIRPLDPLLARTIDIPTQLGAVNNAYVGFTSGTGADWGNHDILMWEYRTEFAPIGFSNGSFVPEPSSGLLLIGGLFLGRRPSGAKRKSSQ
jgi:hypothetical protein